MFLLIADTLIQTTDLVKATIVGSIITIVTRVGSDTLIECGSDDEACNILYRLFEKLNKLNELPLIPNFR